MGESRRAVGGTLDPTMDRSVPRSRALSPALQWLAVIVLAGVFVTWLFAPLRTVITPRIPGADGTPVEAAVAKPVNVFLAGTLAAGPGKPSDLPGRWPRFRGPNLDGISTETVPLARAWPNGRPRELWSIGVGEGYAGPVIDKGRIYLMDYDRGLQRDALRCLSLADGAEIWRYSYPMVVKRNHGMTRTVPALAGGLVVAMGPKCHVVGVDAEAGTFRWGLDLVADFGTTVPEWYTGQCPLVDGDIVVLAPGGRDALLMGVDLASGAVKWRTPNPNGWRMTHSSVVPMEFRGARYFLYCASRGVVAVSAKDGAIAWETTAWKINAAMVPTPVLLGEGRVFLTGGYGAGCMLLQFGEDAGKLSAKEVFRQKADVFGATQHSPIWSGQHLYGIRADGRLVCLSAEGKIVWVSGPETNFGDGPLMVADGLILAMDDSAKLTAAELTPAGYKPIASAQLFEGTDAWAPFGLASGRLLARDLTRMVCLQLAK